MPKEQTPEQMLLRVAQLLQNSHDESQVHKSYSEFPAVERKGILHTPDRPKRSAFSTAT